LFIFREIRQLTRDELTQFQEAVRALKVNDVITNENSWDAMRDEYMQRSPLTQVVFVSFGKHTYLKQNRKLVLNALLVSSLVSNNVAG